MLRIVLKHATKNVFFHYPKTQDLNWMSRTTFKGKTEQQMLKLWNVFDFSLD